MSTPRPRVGGAGRHRRPTHDVDTRLPSILTAATPARIIGFVAALLFALFVRPVPLRCRSGPRSCSRWPPTRSWRSGSNLIVGRVGIYSLCQIPLVAAGAWFSLRLYYLFDENLPFPLMLISAGLLTGHPRRHHRASRRCA